MMGKNKEIERRMYQYPVQIRAAAAEGESSRMVEGYAILFNVASDGLPFKEVIRKEAITEDVIKDSNIFALLNHSFSRGILARKKYGEGTLNLEIDDTGLKYTFEAPKTALGDELLEYLKRGEVDSSSFSFSIADDGAEWIWDERSQEDIRIIKKFNYIYDVSPVYDAAYSSTSVELSERSSSEYRSKQEKRKSPEKNLDKYYLNLRNKYKF